MNFNCDGLYIWEDMSLAFSNEKSIEYLKKYRQTGDEKIKELIVLGNMRLVSAFIKKYGSNIYQKGKANTFEDVAQEAVVAIYSAIDTYDFSKNIKFTTYTCTCVKNMFRNKFRKTKLEKNDVSLNQKVFIDDEDEFIDNIESNYLSFHDIQAKIEYQFIKNNIISLFTKREKEVFHDYYCEGKTASYIAKKHGITRHYVDKMLTEMKEKIIRLYENGVSDYDRYIKGVKVLFPQERRIKDNLSILKKYNAQFLRKYFVPKLSKNQAKIFEHMVLNYYGQSYKYIEKTTKIDMPKISSCLKSSMYKLNKNEKFLNQHMLNYVAEPNKNQKYIDFANNIICQHNGKMFLFKYFVSVLPEDEQKVFSAVVLDYSGEDYSQLYEKCGMTKEQFKSTMSSALTKLKKYDFNVAIDIIENANHYQMSIESLTLEDIKQTKQRIEKIKEVGGIMQFKSKIYPKLVGIKKQIAQDLYLHPKYSNIQSFAEQNNFQLYEVLEKEKEFVDEFLVKSKNL